MRVPVSSKPCKRCVSASGEAAGDRSTSRPQTHDRTEEGGHDARVEGGSASTGSFQRPCVSRVNRPRESASAGDPRTSIIQSNDGTAGNPPMPGTVAQLAIVLNVTPGRISQLAQAGIIPRPERGKCDLVAAVQGYVKYLQARAEGRGVEPTALHEERTRLLKAQAEHKELEVAALHRSLLPFNEVVSAWEQLVAAFRARCLALPPKLAPQLGVIHERKRIHDNTLTAEIRAALEELSHFDIQGQPAARGTQGRRRSEAAAGSNGKSMGRSKSAAEPRGQRRARTPPIH
jgi:phage terminase Nu1 subunit (DNA packaging protein)